ncbi:hypothetical protein PT974_08117 [Cladobotryum mycophilum]|uniref:Glycosyl transferase family 8 protein n=1 Tax=Cladobotryum mycophilum TaxID=491253 RepID=A0ABR0SDL8_9HYPO
MLPLRSRLSLAAVCTLFLFVVFLVHEASIPTKEYIKEIIHKEFKDSGNGGGEKGPPTVKYLPQPKWTPPPIKDPFPLLETASPPPVPAWNKPKKNIHKQYGIDFAPPLFIGFTRSWPILIQCVVSYITAGWPAEQIYVIENTGVQRSNVEGKLSLQNPFYLSHKALKKLGVNVVQAPVLMTFAQMQNYFTYLAQQNDWPYYFWSHMDVLVLSYEDGMDGQYPKANEEGYKSVYEMCLEALRLAVENDPHWANRFFAYDHLSLVNRAAYEEVGGWDPFISYYMNDCDMHSRLLMHNWTQKDAKAGIVTDVSTVLDDFRAFYRDPTVEPNFVDPNPPPPKAEQNEDESTTTTKQKRAPTNADLEYYDKLKKTADGMWHYKHGERGRNTWQLGQQGGQGEPYYYPARGLAEAMEVMTEAGRQVFRKKWGHYDCNLVPGTKLKAEDQWLVEQDY